MLYKPPLHPTWSPGLRPWMLATTGIARPLLPRHGYIYPTFVAATRLRESSNSCIGPGRSGHIETEKNEAVIFVDNLFPLKLSSLLLRRPFQSHSTDYREISQVLKKFNSETLGHMDPIRLVKQALGRHNNLHIEVTQIILRLKDGGAFVKFKYGPELRPQDVEIKLAKVLEIKPLKPWFNPFRGIRASLVHGVPWLEDLFRLPRSRLRVEFIPADAEGSAVELSQEHLYSMFRRYGKIAEITSQPSDSKITPRFAYLDFALTRDAIMARNCLHGLVIGAKDGGGKSGTLLRLSYEDRAKTNWFWNWIKSHPRVVIPAIAALVAAITVVIFDPIRTLFVKLHIQQTLKLTNSRLYRWFKTQTTDLLPQGLGKKRRGDEKSRGTIWEHRKDDIAKIQSWLMEAAESVIVVQGPRGSGKRELLLDQALSGRENVLILDTKPVVDARGESATIRKLAQAIGYRPIFSWANSMSSLVDLAVQSTTGVKSGFSETLESQIAKILHTAESALRKVALDKRSDEDADRNLSDDAWLEAHPEKRAVVVVDNFLRPAAAGTSNGNASHKEVTAGVLNDKISEWSAGLVQNYIAHVVVLVEDGAGASKTLGKAMPDRGFKTVMLGDLSPEVAKKFILSHVEDSALNQQDEKIDSKSQVEMKNESDKEGGTFSSWINRLKMNENHAPSATDGVTHEKRRRLSDELDECIPILGGRLNDLELLARRVRSGQECNAALEEIISQSSSDLFKAFLLTKKKESDRKWSPEQAWYLIRRLAEADSIRYNEVVVDGSFVGTGVVGATPEEALDALVGEELVAFSGAVPHTPSHHAPVEVRRNHITAGRPAKIKPGRPVYQAAFQSLARDRALKATMELKILKGQVTGASKGIEAVERELALLVEIGKTKETRGRVEYLMRKIDGAQKEIEEKERRMSFLKGVLCTTE